MKYNIINNPYNSFTLFNKTEEMKIVSKDNRSISIKDILYATKDCNKKGLLKLGNNNIDLNISFIDNIQISFSVFGIEGENILRNPIKFQLPNQEEVEIVSIEQLKFILESNFKNPKLFCSCNQITDIFISSLHEHSFHSFTIIEFEEIKPLEEISFNKIIMSHEETTFLSSIFNSPTEFEKNFYDYFKIGEKEKKLEGYFQIFDDAQYTRNFILFEFIEKTFGYTMHYFGASGIGKSITLIGSLKYCIPHKIIGTLYINCKTLKSLLEQKKFTKVKNILADEIIYLFYGNYNNYLACFDKINKFNFFNDTDFWFLIDSILEECLNLNKNYIIGFDQYNDFIDPEKYLASLEEKYLYLSNKPIFKFIVISSMNETDVRQKKLNLLFGDNSYKNIRELKYVCGHFETNFKNEELDAFKKLGRTFKAFNEIRMIQNNTELKDYIIAKKKKYLFKLISFYENDKRKYNPNSNEEEILNVSETVYSKFLSFKINYKYFKNEMVKLIDFIPFKLFNVSEEKGEYTITPTFPLLNEIIDDIFRYIVLKKNFHSFEYLSKSKGSAYSSLFEYKIRFNFDPKIKGEVTYFKNFIISDSASMEVITPKETDIIKPKFIKNLQKGVSYLIEQKPFGGKALDFLIIHMAENPEIFGFQVSTHRPEIFSLLSTVYKDLIERLNICFDIKINESNVYFGYIFVYSSKKELDYRPMINNCERKGIEYSYYDVDSNKLYDSNYQETHNIYKIAKNFLDIKDNEINFSKNNDIKDYIPINKLTSEQIITIIDLLKKERNDDNILYIQYSHHDTKIPQNENYVSITNYEDTLIIFYFAKKYLISKSITSNKIIENNDLYFSNSFDIYKILKN